MARNESTVYVGNLDEKVTKDLLYELFLQAGPVENVNIPSNKGKPKPFGFVQFKHPCSVLYAIQLFEGISMFGRTLRLNLPKGAMMPPMGPPLMPHPLSVHGRLGPPVKPSNYYGRRGNDEDRDDSRERHRSRWRDDMMPSTSRSRWRDDMMPSTSRSRWHDDMMPSTSRPTKNRQDADDAPIFDLDSIPDSLDSLGLDGPPKSSYDPSTHRRRRDHPDEDRGNGSHRSHHDSRRDRHSHHPSNHRRRF